MLHFQWRLFVVLTGFLMLAAACNQPADRTSPVGRPDQPAPLNRIQTATFTIQGTAQYADGQDHSGIQVYVPGSSLMAITDDEGAYVLGGLAPGVYTIKARAGGYQAAVAGEVELPATEDAATTQPVTLASLTLKPRSVNGNAEPGQLGSLHGRVAIEGVADSATSTDLARCVIALEGTPYRTTCAGDGSFLLWNLPPDQYRLSARLEGFIPEAKAVRVLPGPEAETVNIELVPLAPPRGNRVLSGFVELIDLQGQPVTDYTGVTIELIGRSDLDQTPSAEGTFAFTELVPDVYRVTASAAGYVSPEPIEVNLSDLPSTEVQLTLETATRAEGPGATLRGVALKDVDDPGDMSGIQVALLGTSLTAITDEGGEFTITQIPPGVYSLIAQAQGFEDTRQGPIELAEGDDLAVDTLLLEAIRDYPTVLSINPADNARNVVVRREMPITIRFSKKMDPNSLRQAIRIQPPVAFRVFAGKERRDTDFDLAKIIMAGAVDEPSARFKTQYSITIDETARDVEGLTLQEPFRASFRTGAAEVIATSPVDGARQAFVGLAQPVEVFFNAPMDPATLTVDSLRIRPPRRTVKPTLSTRIDPITGWTRLLIQSDWAPGTRYEVTVQKGVKTTRREGLGNTPYTFRFETASMEVLDAPNVSP